MDGPEAVQRAVQRCLSLIPGSKLVDQLKKLKVHCEEVIRVSGDYILIFNLIFGVFLKIVVLLTKGKSFPNDVVCIIKFVFLVFLYSI